MKSSFKNCSSSNKLWCTSNNLPTNLNLKLSHDLQARGQPQPIVRLVSSERRISTGSRITWMLFKCKIRWLLPAAERNPLTNTRKPRTSAVKVANPDRVPQWWWTTFSQLWMRPKVKTVSRPRRWPRSKCSKPWFSSKKVKMSMLKITCSWSTRSPLRKKRVNLKMLLSHANFTPSKTNSQTTLATRDSSKSLVVRMARLKRTVKVTWKRSLRWTLKIWVWQMSNS